MPWTADSRSASSQMITGALPLRAAGRQTVQASPPASLTVAAEPIAADRVTAGRPQSRLANAYSSDDGHFDTGLWESTVGRWRVSYTEHEVCVLIAGRVRLIHEAGTSVEFCAGDAFVIPAGFVGEWETLEDARKLYVIYQA